MERLEACVREPIRTPGSIQPHGALLVVDSGTLQIVQASENCTTILGIPTTALLGAPLRVAIGSEALPDVEALIAGKVDGAAVADPRGMDIIVNHSGDLAFIEFEPHPGPGSITSAFAVTAAVRRLATIDSVQELWAATAREVRDLTGFDRVMVYRFHPDDHGEVVAEERAADMEAYLGLHYPASDIPAQARELYLTKLSRAIVTSRHESSPLLSARPGEPLDLSVAELRSVSPHHLEFMRNMGQATTMSFSLIYGGRLIGMITCAHRSEWRVRYAVRKAIEVLATQVASQLGALTEIARLVRESRRRDIRASLVVQVAETDDVAGAILHGQQTVLDLVPAEGATFCIGGRMQSVGETPRHESSADLVETLWAEGIVSVASDAFPAEHPEFADRMPGVMGILLVPIGEDGDFLLWFRQEVTRTVEWLGDQSPDNRETVLSPRYSFGAWSESVTGRSLPWRDLQREAIALCADIHQAFLRRADRDLAELAMRDPLTGLANRRLLMDRLQHALAGVGQHALLFIDLDGFKQVNDTYGHDVGDVVIATAGGHIARATRAHDSVARIGGDEFVVLCENTSEQDAALIAARIVETIREPVAIDQRTVTITASVGVAVVSSGLSATEAMQLADSAMYRAKGGGRDQVSG